MTDILDRLLFAAGDPWILLFICMAVVWALVVSWALTMERPAPIEIESGAAADPYFLDKISEFHHDIQAPEEVRRPSLHI